MVPHRNRAQERNPARTGGLNHWTAEEIAILDANLALLLSALPGRSAKAVAKKVTQRAEMLADVGEAA